MKTARTCIRCHMRRPLTDFAASVQRPTQAGRTCNACIAGCGGGPRIDWVLRTMADPALYNPWTGDLRKPVKDPWGVLHEPAKT